ncbi:MULTISPECIES: LCP family protein [Glycomyces]|uniref:LCP family protein n=2 Tax=Glycomyces TaxID=58113 RepID=A0A9X3PL54_9ACTN|nr:LCP family protein [Glycomyces lechevalierae]MDA1387429.1 LCP family protein [Glycomyces lechevalierae]MDR7338604.1 LCP family protein required for cell wall assembly [Glycomyces lechevalierae]
MTQYGSNYRGSASVPPGGGSGGGARVAQAAAGGPTRRGLIGSGIGLVASIAAAGGGFAVWSTANSTNADLDRAFDLDAIPEEDRPERLNEAMNLLVIGSDHREGNDESDARSDTTILMHVNEDGNAAYGISIPRDLYVYIPEDPDATVSDTTDKFNAAYAWGGVNLTVRTVENLTGVRIDHIIEIDFNGLIAVVDALGGVTMDVQAADADGYVTDEPGIESIHGDHRFFPAGPNKLYGEEALDYVRQRYQYNEGDFARMRHQQELIKAIMDSALSAGVLTDEDKLTSFISSTSDAVKVDTEFNAITTAINLMDMRSDDLVFMTTPNLGTGEQGGQSVVIYADDPQEPESSNPEAVSLWEAVRDDKVEEWIAANPDDEEK